MEHNQSQPATWLEEEPENTINDEDDPDKETAKRKSRNQSEKKRRDQFNVLITDLMHLVSSSSRKMDKTTVLQQTISYLRSQKELQSKTKMTKSELNWKPKSLSSTEFGELMLNSVDGFLIGLAPNGIVLYVSDTISSILGYTPEMLTGKNIYEIIHISERDEVIKKIHDVFMENDDEEEVYNPPSVLSNNQSMHSSNNSSSLHSSTLNTMDGRLTLNSPDQNQPRSPHSSYSGKTLSPKSNTHRESSEDDETSRSNFLEFHCHLRRSSIAKIIKSPLETIPKTDDENYELCKITGGFRKRSRDKEADVSPEMLCFVGCVELVTPILSKEHFGTSQSEPFIIKYSLEFNYIYLDKTASSTLGYDPFDLLGTSGYDHIHPDDLEIIEASHHRLKQENEVQTPSYRLQTKGNQWVWVATHFIVAGNRQTRKPEKIIGKFALCSANQVKHENREIFSRPVSVLPDGHDEIPTSDKETHSSFMSPQSFHSPAPFWDQHIRRQSLIENGHNMGSPNSHISSSGTSHITSASGYQLHLERKNQNIEQQSSRISHPQPSLLPNLNSDDLVKQEPPSNNYQPFDHL